MACYGGMMRAGGFEILDESFVSIISIGYILDFRFIRDSEIIISDGLHT